MEPPSPAWEAPLVLGQQASVQQGTCGHNAGLLQCFKGAQVRYSQKIYFHCYLNIVCLPRFGVFWAGTYPSIFVRDLDLIKKIMVTDSLEHFTDFGKNWKVENISNRNKRHIILGFKPYEENPKNSFGLADLRGESWRKLKRGLTASFSTPRLKKNIHHMNESALKVNKDSSYTFRWWKIVVNFR